MRIKLLVLLMIVAAVLAACGGAGSPTNTPTAAPQGGNDTVTEEATDDEATEEADDEATDEATDDEATEEADDEATEEAGDDSGDADGSVELSESFSGDTATSGTLSLNYPEGYTQAGTADGLVLSNTDTGSTISTAVMPAAAASTMGSTPAEILTAYSANLPTASGVEFSEPEEVTFGSNEGAIITGTATGTETQIAVVEVGDNFVFVTVSGTDSADSRATLEAIASSITLE